MTMVPVSVIQDAPYAFELDRTLDKVADLTAQAARTGARLVVFPEAFVGGYPKGADFGARVGMRSDPGREWFRRYFDGAIELQGVGGKRLGEIAAANTIDLMIGVIEREGGTLYCTAAHFGEDGALVNYHRKVMPTAMERLIWGFGDATTLDVAQREYGRVSAAICWENYMPRLRAHYFDQHVEIYCAPTVDDRDVWQATMRHVAVEGRCFVLAACQFARRSDFPDDYECIHGNDSETVLIRGGSVIIDPFGEVLAGPVFDTPAILHAELDFDQITRGKFDLDVSGHYARPDLWR